MENNATNDGQGSVNLDASASQATSANASAQSNNNTPSGTGATNDASASKEKILNDANQFSESYVVGKLREESAGYRIKARELERQLTEQANATAELQSKFNLMVETRKNELVELLGISDDKKPVYLKMELDALEIIAKDFNKKIVNSLGAQSTQSVETLPETWSEFVALPTDKQDALYLARGAEIKQKYFRT